MFTCDPVQPKSVGLLEAAFGATMVFNNNLSGKRPLLVKAARQSGPAYKGVAAEQFHEGSANCMRVLECFARDLFANP